MTRQESLALSRVVTQRSRCVAVASNREFSRLAAGLCGLLFVLLLLTLVAAPAHAAGPRVLPAGQLPPDRRLQPLKDLDGYFPFAPPASPAEWEKRAAQVRRQLLVANGIWPMPATTPLNPVIHGKVEREGYTVERAYFESFPGFYVTGSLYRPVGKSGKLPAVLCPHGHWPNGRFTDAGPAAVLQDIVNGAERFEEGGRSPLQARCMQLARMGCVVFHYDMLGYADSVQISFDLAHRFAKQRPEMNTLENWGLYSTQAEGHLQSIVGLQTYNSIRALDFITSLPDVDASRVGVTGASGGGTQTMLLGALDTRPVVAFPAVMVSTSMQGGCTCENCSLLRVDTGNIEFASLFAPRLQGMSAANDWTKEMETKGFPEIKKLYGLLGAGDKVSLKATIHFGHNYNYVNRAAMYSVFNKGLKLGLPEPIVEGDYKRLSQAEMTVWDEKHPRPEGGPDFERKLLRHWTDDAQKQLAAIVPKDQAGLAKYREVVGGAFEAILGRSLPAAADLEYEQTVKTDKGNLILMAGLVRNKPRGEAVPMAFLYPKQWNGQVVVWLDGNGKDGLFDAQGEPRSELQPLLAAGTSVVGVDLLYQGEYLADGKPLERTGRVKNTREFAGYTFGYNHTVFASRVHDVLTALAFVKNHEKAPQRIDVVALGETGPIGAAARAIAGSVVTSAVIDSSGFRFGQLTDFHHPQFLPGGAKYHDVPGLLALAAPGKTLVAGEKDGLPALTKTVYAATGATDALRADSGPADQLAARAAAFVAGR